MEFGGHFLQARTWANGDMRVISFTISFGYHGLFMGFSFLSFFSSFGRKKPIGSQQFFHDGTNRETCHDYMTDCVQLVHHKYPSLLPFGISIPLGWLVITVLYHSRPEMA
ncbi:hypothetical protein QBC37DRAFT_105888 [Rhypophila decipiens]|uniref:Uncharacterized protein n=1 Tax=Rhypophila decipiens TaxID=261697 RepID=A0AAN6YCH8_9PEZI|nr:hypothetical protein QBC37DRAFT_105888 [Rhypophila decipiens]